MAKKFFVALVLVLALAFSAAADVTVRLGVTGSVYNEMWQPVKDMLAKEAGISRITINKLENGTQTITKSSTIIKLADALKINPQILLCSKS